MTEAEEIAAGLTDAQRNGLFYPDRYIDPNTVKSLRRRGLMQGLSLTDLGKAVRAILQGEP